MTFTYRKKITFNDVVGCHTNFPVLISTTTNDMKSAPTGHVESASGYDVYFYDENLEKLDHEIDYYDGASGEYVAWVRVPSFDSSSFIWMYYGDSTITVNPSTSDTWDDNYVTVQHMNDATSSTILDSTSNDNDGSKKGDNEPSEVTGKIGLGQDFDGSNDYINLGNSLNGSRTISLWFNSDVLINSSLADNKSLIFRWYAGNADNYGLYFTIWTNPGCICFRRYVGTSIYEVFSNSNNWSANTYYNVVGVIDNSDGMMLYINGVKQIDTDASTEPVKTKTANTYLGVWGSNYSRPFDGKIDEVRLSNIARSEDWIATEYANQSAPTVFLTFTSESSNVKISETETIDDSNANAVEMPLSETETIDDSNANAVEMPLSETETIDDSNANAVEMPLSETETIDDSVTVTSPCIVRLTRLDTDQIIPWNVPDWDGEKRSISKDIAVFNFWTDDIDAVDKGINNEPLHINGTITDTSNIQAIHNAMDNNAEIRITGLGDCYDAVYVIVSFSYSTLKGTATGISWEMELQRVRD
jgi:hypothetical protein